MKAEDVRPRDFRPKKSRDDFFSNRLYRWMLKNKWHYQVWRKPDGVLMIGIMDKDGWFHGSNLVGITCSQHTVWAFPPGHGTKHWEDVTESFWDRYAAMGCCAIHKRLNWHRWDDREAKVRTCLNCGHQERRRTIRVPKVIYEPVEREEPAHA